MMMMAMTTMPVMADNDRDGSHFDRVDRALSHRDIHKHLRDLFDKTIFKNDKDRSGLGEPNLFNF